MPFEFSRQNKNTIFKYLNVRAKNTLFDFDAKIQNFKVNKIRKLLKWKEKYFVRENSKL